MTPVYPWPDAPITPPAPDTFFDKKHGLRVQSLVATVEEHHRFAVDEARRIYRYHDGVWGCDGEATIRHVVALLLDERYRKTHAAQVVEVIHDRPPFFTDASFDTTYLNVPNGLLDWRTGMLHAHTHAIASTIRIPIPWNPDATCPVIEAWLDEVLPFDGGRTFAYDVFGYGLLNDNPLHRAILLHGGGRNGKGTLLHLFRALAGTANCASVEPQALEDRFVPAQLWGKLLNLVGDVDPRTFRATSKFKQMTGGDPITTEHKYGDFFEFICRALLVAGFNALPPTDDTSEGFFSRWIVVPFTQYFPPGVADVTKKAHLTTPSELQGLLVQAVAGLQRVMTAQAIALPPAVQAATDHYRQVADLVRQFTTEELQTAEAKTFTARTALYARYRGWATTCGHPPIPASRFYEQVETAMKASLSASIHATKYVGTLGFKGVRLRESV